MSQWPDLTSPRVLRELFAARNLAPHKKWGQNFLVDANVARKIVAAVEAEPGDGIIEVGPGAGALTSLIGASGREVVAVEIDRGLVDLLKDLYRTFPQVRIFSGDVLDINWKGFVAGNFKPAQPVRLVSNLPYVISGPFLYALFRETLPFRSAILMLQKEVACRLIAGPGDSDYGALSVISAYRCRGEMLFEVGPNVFWPRPKVGSAVVRLLPRSPIVPAEQEEHFIKLVQVLFRQRRKTILNNLALFPGVGRAMAASVLQQAGIDPGDRPERLGVDQFALLAGIIYN